MRVTLGLNFEKGYIAHPYWPAMQQLIDIQKQSGINRMRSVPRREQALRDFLNRNNMTAEDYAALEKQAAEPFYRVRDVLGPDELQENSHDPLEIVIPAHQVYGCLAAACTTVSRSLKLADPEQIRTVMGVSHFHTGKVVRDGVWARYVVVKAGTGNRLSNQRALRSNEFISNFVANGTLNFTGDDEKRLRDFLIWTGENIGVGASRKMDWGRFSIVNWARVG